MNCEKLLFWLGVSAFFNGICIGVHIGKKIVKSLNKND